MKIVINVLIGSLVMALIVAAVAVFLLTIADTSVMEVVSRAIQDVP